MFYKLDENKNVVPCSRDEWNDLYKLDRHVSNEIINGMNISTVFLGLCHNFNLHDNDRTPIVFETIVFDKNDRSIYMKRYSTWEEAEKGHKQAIEWIKNGCKDDN